MEPGTLTIYSASAGSGKTYCLTANYLTGLFRAKRAYRKILAVTFTNKAAAEMKSRILGQLHSLAKGEATDMAALLTTATGRSLQTLSSEAKQILNDLLHDYSGFYAGTIDSFFQRILKAFTREIGLQQGYTIELDHSLILKNAVDATIEGSADDPDLAAWLTDYIVNRAEEGKNWNLKTDILKLAGEIFKEKFRLLSDKEKEGLRNREALMDYVRELKNIKYGFEQELKRLAAGCNGIIQKHNVESNMFLRGDKGGVPSFIKAMVKAPSSIYKPLTATVSQILGTPPVWTTKAGPSPQLLAALNDGLGEKLIEAATYYNGRYRDVNTAILIVENVYILGILSDILENVHFITSAENKFLLSDAGELLWLIIGNDQTPFIYEKTGNAFEHFMIDEFQDTSHIQWNNFRPLILNSMAEGHENLVVGDVKQSIYRWRNSDWSILGSQLEAETDPERLNIVTLETNWRSSRNIVAFNNSVFTAIPALIDEKEKLGSGDYTAGRLYRDAAQKSPGKKEGGYLHFEFIEENAEAEFGEIALSRLPHLIEELNVKGYSGSDIGFLVRKNSEGAEVLNAILDYQSSAGEEKRRKYNYNIISNESLLLSNSCAVNLILACLKKIYSQGDRLNDALLLRYWLLCQGKEPLEFPAYLTSSDSEEFYPIGYNEFLVRIRKLPVIAASESIISFFGLGKNPDNVAYLNTFQSSVLEFSGSASSDVPSFLQWWETTGFKKSIILPDHRDSMRVITIHKAKGLEFKIVIIPFITWPVGHGRKNPVLWLRPGNEPFNGTGIVPVKFKADLQHSHFEDDYNNERFSAAVDNLNLLYVAFTRAIDGLYGFCPVKSGSDSISSVLSEVFQTEGMDASDRPSLNLKQYYNTDNHIFSFGTLPGKEVENKGLDSHRIIQDEYYINNGSNRFHLRFHGDNLIVRNAGTGSAALNYGKLMHRAFESIYTHDDIRQSVSRLVTEGLIPEAEGPLIAERIAEAVSDPMASEWFKPGLRVINEAEILLPSGATKRPDRIIMDQGKVVVIDFKFGEESPDNIKQVGQYLSLLTEMGYTECKGYLWYIEKKKIITV